MRLNERTKEVWKPSISVVIPTCNRPDDVQRCLESLTHVDYPFWDILVVDQSDNKDTEALVARYASEMSELSYKRMHERGLCRARNVGLDVTSGEIVAFLDDDCTVDTDWLFRVADAFDRHRRAAIVYGMVRSVPHDEQQFIIPACEIPREYVARRRSSALKLRGMGASMCVSRKHARYIGRFDVNLGSGATYFPASDDDDYRYRCLALGRTIVETPTIVVRHHGMRALKNGAASRLLRGYSLSHGGLHMKYLRCGEWFAIVLIARFLQAYIKGVRLSGLLRRRSSGLAQFSMYVYGLLSSFRYGVDRHHYLYIDRHIDRQQEM